MKKFCDSCFKEVSCQYNEDFVIEKIDNVCVKYLKKWYVCNECSNVFYDDLLDFNIDKANSELRKMNGIITRDEILEILDKYNIGRKALSLVLGLGEITITRYLDGQNPTKENSELLKQILKNPSLYELYLLTNKEKITELAFKKSLGRTKQLEMNNEESKLYSVALQIIKTLGETTPLALQKILYFINGFSKQILNSELFSNNPEAWIYGPVYKDLYDCFSYYKYNNIDYEELLKDCVLNLNKEEEEYITKMSILFGCYSGNVLREMSHLTQPWISAREGLGVDEISNRIIESKDINDYFEFVCNSYKIKSIDDIPKYTTSIFNQALKNIEKQRIELDE